MTVHALVFCFQTYYLEHYTKICQYREHLKCVLHVFQEAITCKIGFYRKVEIHSNE